MNYRNDIDGLRAIAVIAVILYHAQLALFSGGFVGVDVFFVISGFLITQQLMGEIKKTGTISLSSFFAKRFRRLFPALSVLILTTIVLWFVFLSGDVSETKKFVGSVRYALFGFANIFFKNNSGGYFDGAADEMPLLHFWSLAVEEQFYLAWPLIFLFCGFKAAEGSAPKRIFYSLIAIVIVSFGLSVHYINDGKAAASFFYMPLRAWELGIGALATFCVPLPEKFRKLAAPMNLGGLAIIFFSIFWFDSKTIFPGLWALVPVLGTFLVVVSGSRFNNKILDNRLAVYLGSISYGWYLWHWPFFAMFKVWNMGAPYPALVIFAVIIGSMVMAHVSLKYIETPVRHGEKFKRLGNLKTIGLCLSISGLIILLTQAGRSIEKEFLNPDLARVNSSVNERNSLMDACVDKVDAIGTDKCVYPSGQEKPNSTVIMWGDSHSHSYFPMLEQFADQNTITAVLYSFSGNPSLLPVDDYMLHTEDGTGRKNNINLKIMADIKSRSEKNQTSVILATRWKRYSGKKTLTPPDSIRYLDNGKTYEGTIEVLKKSLKKTISELQAAKVHRIMIMGTFPEFDFLAIRCFKRNPDLCKTSKKEFLEYSADIRIIFEEIATQFTNVRVIDPAIYFCGETDCPQFMKDSKGIFPVVRDDDHPSAKASRYLGTKIKTDLEWLVRN